MKSELSKEEISRIYALQSKEERDKALQRVSDVELKKRILAYYEWRKVCWDYNPVELIG